MNRDYGDANYSTLRVEENLQGYAGLELYRIRQGKKDRIARVLFWDAAGQFFVETFEADVPLDILEAVIAEAKEKIKTS